MAWETTLFWFGDNGITIFLRCQSYVISTIRWEKFSDKAASSSLAGRYRSTHFHLVCLLGALEFYGWPIQILNLPKKKKQKSEAFKNIIPKRHIISKEWFKSKIFETTSLRQPLPSPCVCSNWIISHGFETFLKPPWSILVHQLEMHCV